MSGWGLLTTDEWPYFYLTSDFWPKILLIKRYVDGGFPGQQP